MSETIEDIAREEVIDRNGNGDRLECDADADVETLCLVVSL